MDELKVINVSKTYTSSNKIGVKALRKVNLCVHKNEFLGVMGTSGSGKTTLLNVIAGIDDFDEGNIFINEKNIKNMNKNQLAEFRRKHIGIVFQDFNLIQSLNIEENISVPLLLDRVEDGIIERVKHISELFSIDSVLERYPYEISGGQQQRVAICRAVINNPALILADEPTGNLDSKSSKNVMSYFKKVQEHFESAIFMVTHDPFAASYCDRVVCLADGEIVNELYATGTQKQFLNQIVHNFDYMEE